MPVFERSWENRMIREKSIMPRCRDQKNLSCCLLYAIGGGIESANKLANARVGMGFDKEVSIKALKDRYGSEGNVEAILQSIVADGIVTSEGHINPHNPDRIFISGFQVMHPVESQEDKGRLMAHVLAGGTAVGLFPVTNTYHKNTDKLYEGKGEKMFGFSAGGKVRIGHAVLLCGLGMDHRHNIYWRYLDSHGESVGTNGVRTMTVNLIQEAYIITANPSN